ncbi:hypothetical protein [Paludibacterium paludis]|uniref:Uncharacterized protein n=1 Tax=Paludibacterium paludis TaxID=1225769 RepID=A0A918P4T6_9NEIS|nr:hypothetical protein [Paludibacterium paludis]GGY17630.1 hypothetical protein GCM10011289_21400 [Paludibacterium paludis]
MRQPALPCRQRGIAVLLLVTLIGLGLSVVILSAMAYTRAGQAGSLSLRTQTEAQLRAWTGLEAVRLYLATAPVAAKADRFGTATPANPIPLTLDLPQVSASVTGYATNADHTLQTLTVRVTGQSGGSHAVLEGLVDIAIAAPPPNGDLLSFTGDLSPNGGISFKGDPVNILVKGNFITRTGVQGITQICVTGDISLSGGSTAFKRLCANGDITLASTHADLTEAGGDTSLSGAASVGTLNGNGSASLTGGSTAGNINVIKNITMDSGSYGTGTFTANGSANLNGGSVPTLQTTLGSQLRGNEIGTLKTAASVVSTGAAITGIALVAGNYTENSYGSVNSGQLGGRVLPGPNPKINLTPVPGLTVAIPVVPPVKMVTATPVKVDAYAFKSAANYVFGFDGSGNRTVTVNHLFGLADGARFYLDNSGWMCTVNPRGGACPGSSKAARACTGYWSGGNCFDGSGTGTWNLNGNGTVLAPGVAWFDGNVTLGTGTFFNSVIATGNIATSGNNVSRGVNLSGYSDICENGEYAAHYPTNLCDIKNRKLIVTAAGNLQFLAGSYNSNGDFTGGQITLGSSNALWGDIVAGDHLVTNGSTEIHGAITTSGQSGRGQNIMGGGTTIDMTGLPSSYTPGGWSSGGGGNGSGKITVTLRNLRYL